ncbi:hypothetical protein IFR04_015116 [Cadophora malorum]|uniref:DNL-type domain-containing protein n=1 Tax=Cadophora malorum TaxID=108018 RepID=A0A8H7SYA3_9HELO|nr:hypothetical protein IFR04_015116 [Cadophora malorum]
MPPLQPSFSALRTLSRLSTLTKPFPRQSQLPLFQAQHQHHQRLSPSLPLKRFTSANRYSTTSSRCHSHTHKPHAPRPSAYQQDQGEVPIPPQKPEYEMTFTCTPCSTRSTHRVSKQGYHKGSVLITCPECRNRHVISDHLGIFGDRSMTIEDLMREQGQLVKKGTLSEDGNLEFWADGSTTTRVKEGKEGLETGKEGKGDVGA